MSDLHRIARVAADLGSFPVWFYESLDGRVRVVYPEVESHERQMALSQAFLDVDETAHVETFSAGYVAQFLKQHGTPTLQLDCPETVDDRLSRPILRLVR